METQELQKNNCDVLQQPDWKYKFRLRLKDVSLMLLYIGCVLTLTIEGARVFSHYWSERYVVVSLAIIGIWRYSWWLTHLARAVIYQFKVFPAMRKNADHLWENNVRPEKIIFLMCSYKEDPETSEKVCLSIIRELRQVKIPAEIFISGTENDEIVISEIFERNAPFDDIKVVFNRQRIPDKRTAIGQLLRSINRTMPHHDIPVVFMDGDSILGPGCLRKCLPFFSLYPDIQALTTHEIAIITNNVFFQKWFDLRFAQRQMQFQSIALSRKVLTLTGRMSIFRAESIMKEEFIRRIECDFLDHWLWGTFRFLSGDDKSSWYSLMQNDAKMLYVPDAVVYTIDQITGSPVVRIWQNIIRWSGNMLRNGGRVIGMGPRKVGLFVWWCLVDQRLSTWTCLAGPMAILGIAFIKSPFSALAFVLWILISRFCFCAILFLYNGRIDMTFPFILYFNQLMTASGKLYILFRLPLQRWSNRNVSSNRERGLVESFKKYTAWYLTILYLLLLGLFVVTYAGLIDLPDWENIKLLFSSTVSP